MKTKWVYKNKEKLECVFFGFAYVPIFWCIMCQPISGFYEVYQSEKWPILSSTEQFTLCHQLSPCRKSVILIYSFDYIIM